MTVAYKNLDDEPLSTDDIDIKIDNGNWMANAANEDNYALAARNLLYETFCRPL